MQKNDKGENINSITGGFVLIWGDLHLEGERALFNPKTQYLQAFGSVVLQRGDEIIRGDSLTIDGLTGVIDIQKASVTTPPLYFIGEHIVHSTHSLLAQNSVLSLSESGAGEIKFRAGEIQLENGNRLILRNATFYLYGKPLFRLRHLSLPVDMSPNYGGNGSRKSPNPLSLRLSQISGNTLGIGSSIAPFKNYSGGFLIETSTRQGIQYGINLGHSLFGPRKEDISRHLTGSPGGRDPDDIKELPATPLRQLLTARVPPPTRDPVLDYVDILSTFDPFSHPTRFSERSLYLETAFMGNREFAGSRFGQLMLSRKPEIILSGQLPLSPPANVNNNTTARKVLHTPRFYLSGNLGTGKYTEVRLNEGRKNLNEQRESGDIGFGFNPLLLGKHLLTAGEMTWRTNHYSTDTTYRVTETSLSAAYIFATRTMLGGSLIKRGISGQTPFYFDRIDTQNEAQVRGQIPLLGGRYTLAALGRYDTSQGRLFDMEVSLGVRGIVLEPRFSYRKLNGTIGFNLAIPGLTTP